MNSLYHSTYSRYYKIMNILLSQSVDEPLSIEQIRKVVKKYGFLETEFLMLPKITNVNDGYGLLEKTQNGYRTVLKHTPPMVTTDLEKSWLKTVLQDPKADLFLSRKTKDVLQDRLKDIVPLFTLEDIMSIDTFEQQFDYNDEHYQMVFNIILHAIKNHYDLQLHYESKKSNRLNNVFRPIRLVYSDKADKFQLLAVGLKKYKKENFLFNIEDILAIKELAYHQNIKIKPIKVKQSSVTVEITNIRNAFERSFFQFSLYQTHTIYNKDTGKSTVTIYYDHENETEILINILSFGIAIRVIKPDRFVAQLKARLKMQRNYNLNKKASI